jgi:hypothetical protein
MSSSRGRIWITDFVKHPLHVERLRFELDSPATNAVRTHPHVAYRVRSIGQDRLEFQLWPGVRLERLERIEIAPAVLRPDQFRPPTTANSPAP